MQRVWCRIVAVGLVVAGTVAGASAQAPMSPEEYARLAKRDEAFEKSANQGQPPDKVLDAVGVRPGMVIGEVGAGFGRYTVHLAARVGAGGHVYANDISQRSLAFIDARCQAEKITNVETVLGTVDDPRLPRGRLDMVFMVWVYHMVDHPAVLLKQMVPSLKPGATIVMVEPIPEDTEAEIRTATARTGRTPPFHAVTRENLAADAAAAGLVLEKVMEGFLARDNIYILRVKR